METHGAGTKGIKTPQARSVNKPFLKKTRASHKTCNRDSAVCPSSVAKGYADSLQPKLSAGTRREVRRLTRLIRTESLSLNFTCRRSKSINFSHLRNLIPREAGQWCSQYPACFLWCCHDEVLNCDPTVIQ